MQFVPHANLIFTYLHLNRCLIKKCDGLQVAVRAVAVYVVSVHCRDTDTCIAPTYMSGLFMCEMC